MPRRKPGRFNIEDYIFGWDDVQHRQFCKEREFPAPDSIDGMAGRNARRAVERAKALKKKNTKRGNSNIAGKEGPSGSTKRQKTAVTSIASSLEDASVNKKHGQPSSPSQGPLVIRRKAGAPSSDPIGDLPVKADEVTPFVYKEPQQSAGSTTTTTTTKSTGMAEPAVLVAGSSGCRVAIMADPNPV